MAKVGPAERAKILATELKLIPGSVDMKARIDDQFTAELQ